MRSIHPRAARFAGLALVCAFGYLGSSGPSSPGSNAAAAATASSPAPTVSPSGPVTPAPLSGIVPLALPPHHTPNPTQSRPFFDEFSWESFIAMNWPADPAHRGQPLNPTNPQQFLSAKNGTPVVWTAFRSAYELYSLPSPPPWDSTAPQPDPCAGTKMTNASAGPRHVLLRVDKTGDLIDNINQAFSYPLIDQNRNYARYEVRFNKSQYSFVQQHQYYLKQKLVQAQIAAGAAGLQLPASDAAKNVQGSLMLKAGWRELISGKDDPSRYYTITALIYEPTTKSCRSATVGLVALHIVQKLTSFPEWIWSTFEQVDNVKRGPGATSKTPISFNNGTNTPATNGGWANRPQAASYVPPSQRTSAQITRFNPIPTTPAGNSTVEINARYRQALGKTVWANYELVFTQWPSDPNDPSVPFKLPENGGLYPQNAGTAFPAQGVTNAAVESFFQTQGDAAPAGGGGGRNSCMGCHYVAAQSDFSWSLQNRSH